MFLSVFIYLFIYLFPPFTYGLFIYAVSSSEYTNFEIYGDQWKINWKGCGRKWSWPNIKHYSIICVHLNKILWTNPGGQRGRGRPKSRWIDGVEENARKLGCRNCLADAQDRGRWRHLLEEAKAPTQDCRADYYYYYYYSAIFVEKPRDPMKKNSESPPHRDQ